MADIKRLETKLGVHFKDSNLLEVAITHRSYLNENRTLELVHNERLEFLGDAVLELAVTEHLYRNYQEPEGVLTNWRSALVKTESLAAAGTEVELTKYLRLSRGEAKGSERARHQITANAFEAIIGAIYLDQGYSAAEKFVEQHILSRLPAILKTGAWQDAKTKLQELAQEKDGQTPTYKVLSEEGPDHDKLFTIGVYVGKSLKGKGNGSSKQIGQQAAAAKALEKYA